MTLAGWIYHRRRVTDLKNEIAQVQYIAEPASPPGIQFLNKYFCLHLKIDRRNQ